MSDESILRFSELGLAPPVLAAVDEIGYEAPSPIQAASIPPLLAGRDLLGQAQTGTGKTAAFALPLLSQLDLGLAAPQVLVLTPTRELAIQVAEAMQTYARHLPGFHVLPVYGGQSMDVQLRHLRRGVHVVVGTPGRLLDHLRRRTLELDQLRTVVLDEADEMLRMGFIEDVEAILDQTPEARQVALFSATMSQPVLAVARRYLREPVEIRIEAKTATVASVTQRYLQVGGPHKLDALTRILEVEDFDAVIVFVRTKTATADLAERLEARGYASAALNGDMPQALREKVVERLKRGTLEVIVATDVAARGLDVERISHVVNYDIPNDTEAYVHRIGRTARAGREGDAILFVSPRERHLLRSIERATGQPIEPMRLPSREAVADRRIAQFKTRITEVIESEELGFFASLIADYQLEHDADPSEVAAALAFLLQQERPLRPDLTNIPEHAPIGPERDRRPAAGRPERRDTGPGHPGAGMLRFRIEVGREHGVQPRNIVGAIANEAGLEARQIGHIRLYDSYSVIDLPEGMPREVFEHLKRVWVCGRQLQISRLAEGGREEGRREWRKPGPEKAGGRPGRRPESAEDRPARRPKAAHKGARRPVRSEG